MKRLLLTATFLLSTTSLMHAASSELPLVSGTDGSRFTVTAVSGDGDCAFNAIGKSRSEVVSALKAAINQHDAAYRQFDGTRTSIHSMIAALSYDASSESINAALQEVEAFIANSSSYYSSSPEVRSPSVLAAEALADFRESLETSPSEESFVAVQRMLQSRIQNMYYERYESFQEALRQELQESGVHSKALSTREDLIRGIESVFATNTGRSSWLPMGLIFGVQEHLGLNLAVWSSRDEPSGTVRLYQFSAPDNNVWNSSVRHVVWNGHHFDILTPVSE